MGQHNERNGMVKFIFDGAIVISFIGVVVVLLANIKNQEASNMLNVMISPLTVAFVEVFKRRTKRRID